MLVGFVRSCGVCGVLVVCSCLWFTHVRGVRGLLVACSWLLLVAFARGACDVLVVCVA